MNAISTHRYSAVLYPTHACLKNTLMKQLRALMQPSVMVVVLPMLFTDSSLKTKLRVLLHT
ncbi:hypothetical protein PXH81_01020 [Xylella fastidiosa]|uniref:hypothetical protein n=1 Tax=Xylella fastidiosa TaxID=2371 RepID=UPI000214432D|nr:hypothetical protein [Xylella fastidiosa]EGO80886.1 hypothetical protein XFEB_02247 [Xylella fastidiosa EB92.1]MBE0273147.1 hypothetical protein [Xylella fastidiosa subsp. fastidiosa]TWP39768.1 hypothetical protein FNS27_02210 [Xylella fastidiosa subsp. fastidiosa]WDV83170.1 hypothetical protein PXH81_01020 [Xylella fastidiosa]